jgi:hypothetical protein
MFIGLLFSIIFGSGAESEFSASIPDIQKEIRQHVTDVERRDTLLLLVKNYEDAVKQFDQWKNQYRKELHALSEEREVGTTEVLVKYNEFFQGRKQLISTLTTYRLSFQEKITDDELSLISENAFLGTKKELKRERAEEKNREEALEEAFTDLEGILQTSIEDTSRRGKVDAQLVRFKESIYTLVEETWNFDLGRLERLNDRLATREEIEAMYSELNEIRYQTAIEFAHLRQQIIKNTTADEWNTISRELEVFLKGN